MNFNQSIIEMDIRRLFVLLLLQHKRKHSRKSGYVQTDELDMEMIYSSQRNVIEMSVLIRKFNAILTFFDAAAALLLVIIKMIKFINVSEIFNFLWLSTNSIK